MRTLLVFVFCLSLFSPVHAADTTDKAALEFVKTVQQLIAKDDREALAQLVAYPVTVDGVGKITNAAGFVSAYDAIVTADVKECVRSHAMGEPMSRIKFAYMINWGCIWFEDDEKGVMNIFAVNNAK